MSAPNKTLAAKFAANRAALKALPQNQPLEKPASPEPKSAMGSLLFAQTLLRDDQEEIGRLSEEILDLRRRMAAGTLVESIPLALIDGNPDQPRRTLRNIDSLSENIALHGLLSAIIVRRGENGRYILVAGSRRMAAVHSLGWLTIPAVVSSPELGQQLQHYGLTVEAVAQLQSIAENIARDNLKDFEEFCSYRDLKTLGLTPRNKDIAALVGCSEGQISKMMAFSELPDSVLDFLWHNDPGLVSAKIAPALAQLCKQGHAALVMAGLERLAKGEINRQESLLAWIRKEMGQGAPVVQQSFATKSGKPAFRYQAQHRQLLISLPRGANPDLLNQAAAKIGTLLQELADAAD